MFELSLNNDILVTAVTFVLVLVGIFVLGWFGDWFQRRHQWSLERRYGTAQPLNGVASRLHLSWHGAGLLGKTGFSGTIDGRDVEATLYGSKRFVGSLELAREWKGPWHARVGDDGDLEISEGCPPELREYLEHELISAGLASVGDDAEVEIRDGHLHFESTYRTEKGAGILMDSLLLSAEMLNGRLEFLDRQAAPTVTEGASQPVEIEATTW